MFYFCLIEVHADVAEHGQECAPPSVAQCVQSHKGCLLNGEWTEGRYTLMDASEEIGPSVSPEDISTWSEKTGSRAADLLIGRQPEYEPE